MARVSLSRALTPGPLAGIGPMCTDSYLLTLPEMPEQLAAITTITQLALTASLIGLDVGQLLSDSLNGKIGRKHPLILSLLLFIVSPILCTTTNNIYWLMVWRLIQGITGTGDSVPSRSIACDKYQGVALTQSFALLITVNGLASMLSPVLDGCIASIFGWCTPFQVMAEISTVLLLGCLLSINEILPENRRGSSLLLAERGVVQGRRFMRFCLIQSFTLAGLFAYIGSSSLVPQKEFGFSPTQSGPVLSLNDIGLIIASWIFSCLA